MGLMKQAYDTYCALEGKYAGRYCDEIKEPLVPVSHQIANADIEITLNADGKLLNAAMMDKAHASIIIPVTELSAGRTGDTSCAHPLCDQIRFLTPLYPEKYAAYLTQLHAWENSAFQHPKLHAIARYVEKGTILDDLEQFGLIERNDDGLPVKEKQVVCWRVETGVSGDTPECWRDRTLFQSFIDYYASTQNRETAFCMVSGQCTALASQHPKKIITANGNANAKLISANDSSGFTYRGRFTDDKQAVTVSYDASQKAHNALRWLAANQGVNLGGRTFLCWNPHGIPLPEINAPFMRRSSERKIQYSDYRKALRDTLISWKERIPADSEAVIAAFDAATSGRLSLTYYSELIASDFLERLHDWDAICCWNNGPYGIQSPNLYQIVNCAFGTLRISKNQAQFETDDRVMRQQVQRLISCRVDRGKMPSDIARAVTATASNLQVIPDTGTREKVLSTACAVLRKYHYDRNQEEWKMALEPEKKDISYQYGRLLAVFEKIERDTYDSSENREATAIRMQSVFAKRPQYASCRIWEQLNKAYYPRLRASSKVYYDRLLREIINEISECPGAFQESALQDTYLFGYYLQKNELYRSKTEDTNQEEEV